MLNDVYTRRGQRRNDQMPTEIQDAATTVYSRQSVIVRPSLSNIRPKRKEKKLILPHFQIAQGMIGPTFSSVLFVYILSPPHSSDRRPADRPKATLLFNISYLHACDNKHDLQIHLLRSRLCKGERGGGEKLRSIVGGGGLAIKSIGVRYQRPLPLRRPSSWAQHQVYLHIDRRRTKIIASPPDFMFAGVSWVRQHVAKLTL